MHAAGESSPGNLPSGTHAVVLAVQTEDKLLKLSEYLTRLEIEHVLIQEPDVPYCGAAMAIGLIPVPAETVKKYLKSLRLYSGPVVEESKSCASA